MTLGINCGYGMEDQERIKYHHTHLNKLQESHSLLLISLGTIPLWLDIVDTSDFSGYMYTDFRLGLLWVVSTTSNKAGSRRKIVQSTA